MQFLVERLDQFLFNIFSTARSACNPCEDCIVSKATGLDLYWGLALVGVYSLALVLLGIWLGRRFRAEEYIIVTEGTLFDFAGKDDESSDDSGSDSARTSVPVQGHRNKRLDRICRRRGDGGSALRHGRSRQ